MVAVWLPAVCVWIVILASALPVRRWRDRVKMRLRRTHPLRSTSAELPLAWDQPQHKVGDGPHSPTAAAAAAPGGAMQTPTGEHDKASMLAPGAPTSAEHQQQQQQPRPTYSRWLLNPLASCHALLESWAEAALPLCLSAFFILQPIGTLGVYWADTAADWWFLAAYQSWNTKPGPPVAMLGILLGNLLLAWALHLRQVMGPRGWGRLRCLLVGIATCPLGIPFQTALHVSLTAATLAACVRGLCSPDCAAQWADHEGHVRRVEAAIKGWPRMLRLLGNCRAFDRVVRARGGMG